MSTYAHKERAGKIFDNREDKRSARSPDYTGTALIRGVVWRVIGWYNPPDERNKKSNINLIFQEKEEFDREQQAKREGKPGQRYTRPGEDFDDDIPF